MTTTINGKALVFNECILFGGNDMVEVHSAPFPLRIFTVPTASQIGAHLNVVHGRFDFSVEGLTPQMHDIAGRGTAFHNGKSYLWHARVHRVAEFQPYALYQVHLTIIEQ